MKPIHGYSTARRLQRHGLADVATNLLLRHHCVFLPTLFAQGIKFKRLTLMHRGLHCRSLWHARVHLRALRLDSTRVCMRVAPSSFFLVHLRYVAMNAIQRTPCVSIGLRMMYRSSNMFLCCSNHVIINSENPRAHSGALVRGVAGQLDPAVVPQALPIITLPVKHQTVK